MLPGKIPLKRKLMTQHPDLLDNITNHESAIKMCLISKMGLICWSAAVKKNLTVVWPVNLWQKAPKSDRSICQCHRICQNWQDSKKNCPCPHALICQMRLAIFSPFWQSAHPGLLLHWRETNSFFPPSLPLLIQLFWGICSKIPSFFYIRKRPGSQG